MSLLVLLACAAPAEPAACQAARDPGYDPLALSGEPPRKVLVISLDTVRPERLGPESTPHIDALLSDSLVLDAHWSCSDWTFPSMVCAQAGLRPFDAGFLAQRGDGEWTVVPDEVALASEILDGAGWQTALVSSNANFGSDVGLDAGFQHIEESPGASGRWVTDRALVQLLSFDPSRPWYLHAHYIDPHHPYSPPPSYLGALEELAPIDYDLADRDEYERMAAEWPGLPADEQALVLAHLEARYAAEYRYADDQIGRLLTDPALDDALVVFFTDHGEQLFEHGRFGHRQGLYGEELRAVASLRAPGLSPGRWGGPSSHQDIWPSVLALLGVSPPEDSWGGYPLGQRPADSVRSGLRSREGQLAQFAECGGTKLIYWWDGARAMFELTSDPGELVDIYDRGPPAPLWSALLQDIERVLPLTDERPEAPG